MSAALLDQVLACVRRRREGARAQGVDLVGVVGSVARRDTRAGSDVDIAYSIVGPASLFDLGEIQMDLQDDLGRPVDLIDLNAVKPRVRQSMERDLVRA